MAMNNQANRDVPLMRGTARLLVLIGLCAVVAHTEPQPANHKTGLTVDVMSFNIRYDTITPPAFA